MSDRLEEIELVLRNPSDTPLDWDQARWLADEVRELRRQLDGRVSVIEEIQRRHDAVAPLLAEIDRLKFLHQQDHALADRYQEHREAAEREMERLKEGLFHIRDFALGCDDWRMAGEIDATFGEFGGR